MSIVHPTEQQMAEARARREDTLARLREPFPPEQVGKLPKPTVKNAEKGKCKPSSEGGAAPGWQDYFCGGWHGLPAVHLDYVGHAAVSARLLDVDPLWNWEPVGVDDAGWPMFDRDDKGNPVGLWIRLTVCGVTRLGFGSVASGAFDAEKQLIGDALRNAAMRFGVALDLWVKGHAEDDEQVAAADDRERSPRASSRSGSARKAPPECDICKQPALEDIRKHGQGYVHKACFAEAKTENAATPADERPF